MDNRQNIEAALQDMEDGIEMIKSEYGGLIKYVVSSILSDPRDAEECQADVYIKVWQNISAYDSGKGELSSWISVVARNTAVTFLRGLNRGESELTDDYSSGVTPEDQLIKADELEELKAAILELKSSERQLIYRRYFYLQDTKQIAAELGMSERAVEGRLYRIRKKLKKALGGERIG